MIEDTGYNSNNEIGAGPIDQREKEKEQTLEL